MAIAGKDKRTFFSLQAAADLIVPIIAAVDAKAFDVTKFQVTGGHLRAPRRSTPRSFRAC